MHPPTFPDTFSSNNLAYIYVGTLQNIYFNVKDSEQFDKFVSKLVYLADTSVCKPRVWGPLGAPETVAFLSSKYVSSTIMSTFC